MIKIGAQCNIAFLTHGSRNIGGGEQSWYFLITRLDRRLFEPVVFYSNHNRIIEQIGNAGIPTVHVPIAENITSLYRDQVSWKPWSLIMYGIHLLSAVWRVFRLLKRHDIHVLHAHDNLSKIIGVLAAKLARAKIITNCNDQLGKAPIDRLLLFLQRYWMDRVFCVTHYIGNTFAKSGQLPENVAIVYSAIEPEKWNRTSNNGRNRPTEPEDKKLILGIVAVFDEVKGHRYLFEAIAALISEGITNFSCWVVGDGRERDRLHAFVRKKGIESHVVFHGFVANLKDVLEKLDILIVPSLQEAFGMAAVEAMAMEIPVIASKVGGLPEVVQDGETGILVPSADSPSLAAAIKHLMDRPDLRSEMGRKGKERVRRFFDISKNLKASEKIIWDLAHGAEQPMREAI